MYVQWVVKLRLEDMQEMLGFLRTLACLGLGAQLQQHRGLGLQCSERAAPCGIRRQLRFHPRLHVLQIVGGCECPGAALQRPWGARRAPHRLHSVMPAATQITPGTVSLHTLTQAYELAIIFIDDKAILR